MAGGAWLVGNAAKTRSRPSAGMVLESLAMSVAAHTFESTLQMIIKKIEQLAKNA